MKIKILLFVNLVLMGTAIGLYLNRSTGPAAAPMMTGDPARAPIPPETPPPWNETASNVSPSSVDGIKSNAVLPKAPQAQHHQSPVNLVEAPGRLWPQKTFRLE